MSDRTIEDILAVIEFEKEDDQKNRRSANGMKSAVAESTVIPENAI